MRKGAKTWWAVMAATIVSVAMADPSIANDQTPLDDPAHLARSIVPELVQAQDEDARVDDARL
ncbi:hypothetical protein [Agromyces aerolatus]|uniref:hypothetical protein n=1 Tax=Agromyces sp. LY-1074 TaxID=3074080 RepID=UPI00286047B3|nr:MULTISPECIES: hypothetical protein [unclassified Agromyces]MDR5701544.1 hypothetical protein [Agromyces sp. LY-1074]MDR5707849.1 hypothetical protein [Agromyces sp. LY-1358]